MKKCIFISLFILLTFYAAGNSEDECTIKINTFSFTVSWSMQTQCMELYKVSSFFEIISFADEYYDLFKIIEKKLRFECYFSEKEQKFVINHKQYNLKRDVYENVANFRQETISEVKKFLLKKLQTLVSPKKVISDSKLPVNLYMVSVPKYSKEKAYILETELYIGAGMGFLNNRDYLFSYYFTKNKAGEVINKGDADLYIFNKKTLTAENIDSLFFETRIK